MRNRVPQDLILEPDATALRNGIAMQLVVFDEAKHAMSLSVIAALPA
jgi:hypothetical protein